ncbi:MAG TPA: phosphatidate cytidylyltransferase [Candidatus Thalassarchaeaceae archaeon]|jgi:CDP-diglyceride synthetase|nr:phosphatidate cytidylyltransferase [Candidatus Thalassarchaeaceae archaeon]MDP6845031.1 phosphatidate cytidylyltransferase [Candidatus Thalassarchaeaceae archaeon]HJM40675.1 phosphatidate cytidylyltransferase [Candidatus Thalassarchaeaceae archaeon]
MDLGIETEAVALAAPYVLGFMGFMYGLLLVFAILRWNQSQDVIRNMWTRSLVATPLLVLLFASLEFGVATWGFMVGVFALGAHREYCAAIELKDRGMQMVGMVVLLALIIMSMNPNITDLDALSWAGPQGAGLLGLALFVGAFGTWAVPIVQDRSENVTSDVGRALIGFLLIWFFIHGIFLMHLGAIGVGACIFAIVNVSVTDSFALIFGRIFGKHKFRPVLSPKKTWEGVFGGLLMAGIAGYVAQPLLDPLTATQTAGLAVLLAMIGTMGDLMLSALKRDLELKDWSQMLPGHGGILDRVDSFILVAPALYWILLLLGV